MSKTRDSFIFYRSFFESTLPLDKEQKAELFDAICNYALDGKLIELSGMPKGFFTLIKPQLDANRKKWANGCKEKSKKELDDEPEESKTEAKDKQTISKTEGNVNDNVECKSKSLNENKKVIDNQFEEFWKNYKPIHTTLGSKKDAKTQFERALKDDSFENILTGLKSYMADCHAKGTYTKQVDGFLKKELWKNGKTQSNDNLVGKINKMIGGSLIDKITLSSANKPVFHLTIEKHEKLIELSDEMKKKMMQVLKEDLSTDQKPEFKFL